MEIAAEILTIIGKRPVVTHGTSKAAEMAAFLEPLLGENGLSDTTCYEWRLTVCGTGIEQLYECTASLAAVEDAQNGD